jgi:hypothetical protein
MQYKNLTVGLFFLIMSMLIWQRFVGPDQLAVVVSDSSMEESYFVGDVLERGQTISTTDGFLSINIGDDTQVYLATNTEVEISRIFSDEIVLILTKGRMVASSSSEVPLVIMTNFTEQLIHKSTATFVNYDFLGTIHVIPIDGNVQFSMKDSDEFTSTPVPISIHETEPIEFNPIEVNLGAGDASEFYSWTGVGLKE